MSKKYVKWTVLVLVFITSFFGGRQLFILVDHHNESIRLQAEVDLRPEIDKFMAGEAVDP